MHRYVFSILLMMQSILYSSQLTCNKWIAGLYNENTIDTPLCAAVRNDNFQDVEALLNQGCDVNLWNNFGHTPLMLAAAYNNIEMCQFLLSKGADINKYSSNGTALSVAARYNSMQAAIFLIEQKANINQGAHFNYATPLEVAAFYNRCEMVELLLKHKVDINPEPSCIEKNAIGKAIYWGHCHIVLLLLRAGARVNQRQNSNLLDSNTYLHIAAAQNQIKIAKLLLRYRADASLLNDRGEKPSDLAKNKKMKYLLNNAQEYKCLLLIANRLEKKYIPILASLLKNQIFEWLGYS